MLGCDFEPGMWVRHKKLGFKGRVIEVCHRFTYEDGFCDRVTIKEGVTVTTWKPSQLEIIPDEPTNEELQNRIGELEKEVRDKDGAIKEWEKAYRLVAPKKCSHFVLHIDGVEMFNEWREVKP